MKPMRLLLAAVVYYAIVFASGFVIGVVRVLAVQPYLGVRLAELAEAPIMLTIVFVSARVVPAWFAVPRRTSVRLAVGAFALSLLLASELCLLVMQRLTLAEYLAMKDPVAGTVYGLLLLVFALAPALVARVGPAGDTPQGTTPRRAVGR